MGQSIQNPFPVFFDNDGKTLEDGYIYIGESGLNPETSLIDVFWDKAFLYPAAQPIRTVNGLPSRNGSPSSVFTSQSDYSILVKDKTLALIFSSLVSTSILNDVDSIAELRTLSSGGVSGNQNIFVSGYYTVGDGGGGHFYWDPISTETDNGGTIIQAIGIATGRWKRIYSGQINVKWFGAKGDGSDDNASLQLFVSFMNDNGGVGFFPYTGSGYSTSGELAFTKSNITLIIDDDITNTKTTKSSLITFTGTSSTDMITNIVILGRGNPKLDGNGSNITGYTYSSGDALYDTVRLIYVNDYRVEGVTVDNGLIDSFKAIICRKGFVAYNNFTGSIHDNGCSINQDLTTYSSTDADTWAMTRVENCNAWGNEDFGFTAFDSTSVMFALCDSWNNGTNSSTHNPGNEPAGGGFSYEDDNVAPDVKNYKGKFIGCRAFDNINAGFLVTGNGVIIDESCESLRTTSTWVGATPSFYGNGVRIINATDIEVYGKHRDNQRNGIHAFGDSSGQYIGMTVGAHLEDNLERGLFVQGCDYLTVTDKARIKDNGVAGNKEGIIVTNLSGTYNHGLGVVNINGGWYEGNGNAAIKIKGVHSCIIKDPSGKDNSANATAPAIQIVGSDSAVNTTYGRVDGAAFSDSGANQTYVVQIVNTVDNGSARNIEGDGTAAIFINQAVTHIFLVSDMATATAWTDSTAQTNFNTLLTKLETAGIFDKV